MSKKDKRKNSFHLKVLRMYTFFPITVWNAFFRGWENLWTLKTIWMCGILVGNFLGAGNCFSWWKKIFGSEIHLKIICWKVLLTNSDTYWIVYVLVRASVGNSNTLVWGRGGSTIPESLGCAMWHSKSFSIKDSLKTSSTNCVATNLADHRRRMKKKMLWTWPRLWGIYRHASRQSRTESHTRMHCPTHLHNHRCRCRLHLHKSHHRLLSSVLLLDELQEEKITVKTQSKKRRVQHWGIYKQWAVYFLRFYNKPKSIDWKAAVKRSMKTI